jgi:hypothetical protein
MGVWAQNRKYTRSLTVHLSLTFSPPRFSPSGSRIAHARWRVWYLLRTSRQRSSASIWRQFLKSTVFLEIHETCSKCTLHILQLLCKYFTLLFFKSCLPVAMTPHYLDLWHLKTYAFPKRYKNIKTLVLFIKSFVLYIKSLVLYIKSFNVLYQVFVFSYIKSSCSISSSSSYMSSRLCLYQVVRVLYQVVSCVNM